MSVVCDPGSSNPTALRGIALEEDQRITQLLNHFKDDGVNQTYPFRRVDLEEYALELLASRIADFMANTPIITTAFSASGQLSETEIAVCIDPLQVSLNNFVEILNSLYYEYPNEYGKFREEDDYDNNQIPHPDYQRCLKRYISLRIKPQIPTGSLFKLMSKPDVRFRTFIIGDCENERVMYLVPDRKADFDRAWAALNDAATTNKQFNQGKLIVEEGILLKALVPDKEQGIDEIQGLASLLGDWKYNIKAVIPLPREAGGQTFYYTTDNVIP
jgi:hypothetical protein